VGETKAMHNKILKLEQSDACPSGTKAKYTLKHHHRMHATILEMVEGKRGRNWKVIYNLKHIAPYQPASTFCDGLESAGAEAMKYLAAVFAMIEREDQQLILADKNLESLHEETATVETAMKASVPGLTK